MQQTNQLLKKKAIEKCGMKIIDEMKLTDPFRTNCKEPDCLACKNSEEYSNCRKSNIGYTLQCELCKSRGKIKSYEGESARSGYQRSREHVKQFEGKQSNSVIYKHISEDHNTEEDEVDFKMKVVCTFKTPLQRIIN